MELRTGPFVRFSVAFAAIFLFVGFARAEPSLLPLRVAGHQVLAEVARTPKKRAQGLMHRKSLGANRGMLFVFPETATQSMWMVNTFIPLSVAFIDRQGVILNIADMAPQTKDVHSSRGNAKYALEMNSGWFARHGIIAGAKVEGLAAAPAAE